MGMRLVVGFVSLILAPVVGLFAGGAMPNPPGNGPGTGQVIVGVLVPLFLSVEEARGMAQLGWVETVAWGVAALVATGALVLFLVSAVGSIAA